LFHVIIIPVLTYGCQVWFTDHCQASLIATLQVAQNEACRKLGGFFCTTPTNIMHNLLAIPPIRYRLHHLLHQACTHVTGLPPSVALLNPACTRGATGISSHVECQPTLPPSEYDIIPFNLAPHPSTPPWCNPRFTLHSKLPTKNGYGPSKRALRDKNRMTWKVWIMVTKAQASERSLALYCVFHKDIPFISDYTPFTSKGGLLLALSLALTRIPRRSAFIFATNHVTSTWKV
jgi:hypothetical protein